MNLRTLLAVGVISFLTAYAYGMLQYNSGWDDGRQNLVQQQQAKAQAKLAKQTTRQQANDSKAAAADESGKATAEVITRDVIKYIKTPGRSEPQFSDERVRIKSTAADNAACIPEFDDCSVQTGTGK
ncbi:MAG: hypothetical protein ACRCZ6_15210 [Kluyvera sp.]|uniref:hypothetical protein n=1 Tax=Kluyvera sp. TaxID=1538228 RepID=UPI003F3DD812